MARYIKRHGKRNDRKTVPRAYGSPNTNRKKNYNPTACPVSHGRSMDGICQTWDTSRREFALLFIYLAADDSSARKPLSGMKNIFIIDKTSRNNNVTRYYELLKLEVFGNY